MDWSLVLASQGIEAVIEAGEKGWGLLVAAQDLERAMQAIHLYQLENRRWPWRRELFEPGILFDWASLVWVFLVGVFYWLKRAPIDLSAAGAMDSVAVSHGQWWRLLTAVWLHADLGHLASNACIGFVLLGMVMGRFGTGTGLLAAYLAGVGGNLLVWLLAFEPHYSLGASGMVMATFGLLAVQSFSSWRQTRYPVKYTLTCLFAGLMLFLLFGASPGTDVLAHFGGFLSGLLLGGFLVLVPGLSRCSLPNLISGLVLSSLIVLPWYLALRH